MLDDGKGIAFFDLDGTVLSVNSAVGWLKKERREGYLTVGELIRALYWVGRYSFGAAEMDDLLAEAVTNLVGREESELATRSAAYWQEEVVEFIRPIARQRVEAHRLRGDRVVLLTSSSEYLGRCAVDALQLDDKLCNRFQVDPAGRFTGEIEGTLCFGVGKLKLAQAYCRSWGAELGRSTFYTDSYSDAPLMEVVGRPVAVNPDFRLKRKSRRQGWRIEDWRVGAEQTPDHDL